MENASKALLMAGGILLGIIVISLMIFVFTQISEYRQTANNLEKDSELAKFNAQFVQYAQNNLKGIDLIALLNKVIEFNGKDSGAKQLNYDEKITITVNVEGFNERYVNNRGRKDAFFSADEYIVDEKSDDLMNIIKENRNYEDEYGSKAWNLLSSNEVALKKYYNEGDKRNGKSVQDILGKQLSQDKIDKLDQTFEKDKNWQVLENHGLFVNFKTSEFKIDGDVAYYSSGQIKSMKFRFK